MTPKGRRGILFLAALAVLAVLVGASGPAAAHAEFVSSTPGPFDIWNVAPTYVSVTVSEAVQPGSPTIIVTAMNGSRVDVGAVTISATDPATFSVALEKGIGPSVYTVTWTVVSADDGHFTAGTFYFMVSYRDGTLPGSFPQTGTLAINQPISPLDVALEAIGFVAFAAGFGGTLLTALLWVPAGSELEEEELVGPADGLRALLRLSLVGGYVFAAVAAARIVEALASAPLANLTSAFGSTYLLSLTAQYVLSLAMVGLLARISWRPSPTDAFRQRPWEFMPALFLGFMLILLEVAVSHSATASAWWPLGPVADAAHLYGAALWVGGLLAVVRARRWLKDPTPPRFAQAVLEGFSRFALLGVVLVVSAGFVLALVLVGTWSALVGTAYGWVVLAKGALLVPMVVVGAWNGRRLRRAREAGASASNAVRLVARNARAEAVAGAAVLVLAGLLVTMSPAASPQPLNPTFTLETTTGGLYALFLMNPWPAGPGTYIFQTVVYYAGNETAYYGGGNATMSFLREGGNGTAVTLPMEGPHGNHSVILDSPVLDAAGTWAIDVDLRGPSGVPVTLPFHVTISG